MWYKELTDDFASMHGKEVLETSLPSLERYADSVLTKQLLLKFLPVLERFCLMTVKGCKEHILTKYTQEEKAKCI